MRSGGNNFKYFPRNKLAKLANLVQFKRMLMSCLENWEWGLGPLGPLVYATGACLVVVYANHLYVNVIVFNPRLATVALALHGEVFEMHE